MYENFVGTWETVRNREVSVLERCPHGEVQLYFEMLAIYLALQSFAKGWVNTHIRLMCDNTSAVHVVNHMGTSHSNSCNSLAK